MNLDTALTVMLDASESEGERVARPDFHDGYPAPRRPASRRFLIALRNLAMYCRWT
jgi:hypothetical protein